MLAYYIFLKKNFSAVFFGWLLTFFSSFGQTFLISIFVPFILIQFEFSKTEFGAYYAVATIIASFFLLQYGHIIDSQPVKPFTLKAVLILAVSCLLLGLAVHPAMVFLALIGLRLGGQGFMSHISLSVMSRYFTTNRGKALSLSALGYPMGEMIFPLLVGIIITFYSWQVALVLAAILLVLVLVNVKSLNLEMYDAVAAKEQAQENKWKYFGRLIKEKPFWILIFPVFFYSFITTGIFFFQYVLAKEKNWPLEYYSMCFTGYAIVRFLFLFYGGLLTDKLSARTLFPFYLIPLTLGLVFLSFITGKIAALLFLLLIGVTAGTSSIISSAVIAELYGTNRVGQVRSLFSMIMVFSSALAPVLFGLLLDMGIAFKFITLGCAVILTLSSINSLRIQTLPI